jgi:hypothetical protein
MSSSIEEYGEVIIGFLNEVSIYNKIEKAEKNSNERVINFQKFITQNKSLLANFTGVEKHISYFIDTYNFEQIFDYSIIENAIPELQVLSTKLNLLLDKVKQVVSFNKKYANDGFVLRTKDLFLSCKEKMTLRDITQKVREVDMILVETDNVLAEINTLNNQSSVLSHKLQQMSAFYDRYNKLDEESKAQKLIANYNNTTQIIGFSQQIQLFTKQTNLVDIILNSFDDEEKQLKKIQNSLSSNVNIWKEDADYFDGQINSFLPKLSISKFDINSLLDQILQKENERKNEIINYENSISAILTNYQSWLKEFKVNQKTKVEFEQLKKKITDEETRKSNDEKKKMAIAISVLVAVVTVIILGIIYPEEVMSTIILVGIIAFVIWRKTRD